MKHTDLSFRFQVLAGTGLVWTLGRSLRVSWHRSEHLRAARGDGSDPVIYAFWHQRLLPFCFTHRQQGVHVLVSTHRDGELIARIIGNLGFETVRGSSTRGGLKALYGMSSQGKQGFDLAVTPDGPRGPRYELKAGLITVARMTGCPVLPIANAVWPRMELNSWDRFHIPAPFARCSVVFGEPWWAQRDDKKDREAARIELERRLMEATREADHLVDVPSGRSSHYHQQ